MTGRQVNLSDVVAALDGLGIPAYVEQTGGGCATVYVGLESRAQRYGALVGPGRFDWSGSAHMADADDLWVGFDDDGASTPLSCRTMSPAQIAAAAAAFVQMSEPLR